jgi:hypothetical protein
MCSFLHSIYGPWMPTGSRLSKQTPLAPRRRNSPEGSGWWVGLLAFLCRLLLPKLLAVNPRTAARARERLLTEFDYFDQVLTGQQAAAAGGAGASSSSQPAAAAVAAPPLPPPPAAAVAGDGEAAGER